MRTLAGALGVALLIGAAAAAPSRAQEPDAYVLRPGAARFSAGLRYTQFERLFADGGTAALAEPLLAPLTSRTFAPLAALEGRLNGFLAASGSTARATPDNLGLGTPDLQVALDARIAPFRLELGVLPGLEVGVQLPLTRSETRLTRFALGGGTVGLNPDTAANARALAGLGAGFRALGAGPLLPTAGSALGVELQARARARGATLTLPTGAVNDSTLPALLARELGVAPLASGISPFRLGDLELDATYRLLSTLGNDPFPTDTGGVHFRVALTAGLRLPTGTTEDTARLFSALPAAGVGGYRAGVVGDLFVGRIWGTASVSYQAYTGADVLRLVAPASTPLLPAGPPRTVRWTPGSELAVRVAPRFRITEHLAAGAQYELLQLGDAGFGGEGAELLAMEGGTAQRIGGQFRYTTLASWLGGAGLLPAEILFGFETAISGPSGMPDATTVRVEASLFRSLWGR